MFSYVSTTAKNIQSWLEKMVETEAQVKAFLNLNFFASYIQLCIEMQFLLFNELKAKAIFLDPICDCQFHVSARLFVGISPRQ